MGRLDPARFCCGKTCHRALPGCPHMCERLCHTGACTSQGCTRETTVRCACKRLKAKLPCSEVQRLLEAATGSSTYDGTTSMRLLPCDAACAKAAAVAAAAEPTAAAGAKDSSDSQQAPAGGSASGGAAAAAAAAATEQQQPRRKLSKEEKAQLAEEKARAKEAAARRKQLVQAAVLGAVVLLAVLLALGVRWLMLLADQKAQAAWGRQEL